MNDNPSPRGVLIAVFTLALAFVASAVQAAASVPPGGRSILIDPLKIRPGENKNGRVRVVDVQGPGFARALEVESKVRKHDWNYQVFWRIAQPLKKGDVVLARFWARTVWTADESGQSAINVRFEVPGLWKLPRKEKEALAPLTKGILLAADAQWREYFIRAQAPRDMAAKDVFIALRCGMQRQRVQFGGIDILDYGRAVKLADLPVTRYTYAGREPDAPWRKEAEARIRRLRTRGLRVVVLDARGRPVKGARIQIELQRHAFQFGAAFGAWQVLEQFNPDYQQFRKFILDHYSSASFINALKWHAWAGDWGPRMRPNVSLAALRWVASQKLPFRGHCLVWPRKKSVSRELRRMLEALHPDPQAIEQKIIEHLRSICPATKFWMEEWDVLNESIPCHDVQDICGDEVMVEWFKETRRLLPRVRLALNEYSILASRTDTEKVLKHEARIKYLLDHGAPLDVLGMQCHMGAFPPSPLRIWSVLQRFAKFGLAIRATEYTLKSDDPSLVYDFTRDFYTIMFSHPQVIGIQMWGVGQMRDKQGRLSPLGRAYGDLVLNKWRTRASGATDAAGAFSCRGFFGQYAATITANGKSVRRTFDLPKGEGVCEITLRAGE